MVWFFSGLTDVIFSTAHKAKGLEFDTVLISDDFLEKEVQGMMGLLWTVFAQSAFPLRIFTVKGENVVK